ncbi:MAG TPA: hypothetical protein VII40_21705 [Xanthobacteraceae bacterium]|jgi:hypothetical protein
MSLFGIPLLIIPFAVYNMLAFLLGIDWSKQTGSIQMVSGAPWALSYGEIMIGASVIILFFELLKSTRLTTRTIIDHSLSTVLFIGMLIEFLLVQKAATGTFFLLLIISFVDVIGGFTIAIRSAQREVTVEGVEKVAA